VAFKVTTGP